MKNESSETGVGPILRSFGAEESGRAWDLLAILVTHMGWLLLPFVLVIYLLSPSQQRTGGLWIVAWFAAYLVYQIATEVLHRVRPGPYETFVFRMARVQAMLILVSALLFLTGGSESYFWFVYLWPLFASALYFRWRVMWGIYVEVVVLYFLSSLRMAGGLAQINYALLLANLSILFVLTVVLRYLVESIRRYQETEEELELSEVLKQIQQDVDTAIDLQEVLDRILRRAVDLVGARDGSLMLLDERGELSFRARVKGLEPAEKEERSFRLGQGIAGWVAQNRQYYVCRDTQTDEKFADIIAGFPIRSLVSVPIISHGTVLGVINVDSTEPNRFSRADAELLTTLADQTAVAIERGELLESLRQIGDKTLGGAEDLYEQIVEDVHQLTRCPAAMWRLDEKDRTQATIRAFRGLRKEYARERVLDLQHSVTGEAIQSAELIQIDDIEEDPRVTQETKDEASQQGWKSMLVVPLLAGPERAVGTLSVYGSPEKRFGHWEIDILRTFASHAGVAIQNTERLQTIQRLNEVGQSLVTLQESPETLEETLQRIADTAVEVLSADIVDLYQYRADLNYFPLPPIMAGERQHPELVAKKVHKDDVVVKIVESGRELYATDAQGHSILTGEWEIPRVKLSSARFVVREGIVSSAALPLKIGEAVVGVMFVNYRARRDFDAERELREKIEVFANQAAIAIYNARLYRETLRHLEQLATLNEISSNITSTFELDDILESIAKDLIKLAGARRSLFLVADREAEKLIHKKGIGYTNEHLEQLTFEEMNAGLSGWVLKTGEPALSTDAQDDPRQTGAALERARELDTESLIVAPLAIKNKTIGTLTAVKTVDDPAFTEDDKDMVVMLANQAAIAIENAKLFQELDERATQLERLQEVTATISAEPPDLDKVLRLIVDHLGKILPGASCAVRLYDSKEDAFESQVATGVLVELAASEPRPDGTSRYVVDTKSPRYLEGDALVTPPDEGPSVREAIREKGVRAAAYLPLISDGDVAGILYVTLTHPYRFSQNERQTLELYANQAAIAIENVRLFEQLKQERVERIKAIQKIGFGITAETDLEKVLDDLLQITIGQVGEDSLGDIWLLDEEAGKLKVRATQGAAETDVIELRIGQGIVGWVAQEGDPYLSGNVVDDKHFVRRLAGTRSEMAVPMLKGDQLIGVLNIEHPEPNAFDQEDIPLLQLIASQVVVALENARLFEETQASLTETEALYRVSRSLTAFEGLTDLLQAVVDAIAEALPADRVTLINFDLETEQVMHFVKGGPGADHVVQVSYDELRSGLSGWVLSNLKPALSPKGITDKRESPESQRRRAETNCGAILAVPLRYRDKTLGTMTAINSPDQPDFTQRDLELMVAMASQAAVAIENARLFESRGRKIKELEVLTEIGRTMSNLSIDKILALIYKQASKIMYLGDALFYVAFYDDEKDEVSFGLIVEQDDGKTIDKIRRGKRNGQEVTEWQPRLQRKPPGLTEYVIRTKEPRLIAEDFEERTKELGIKVFQQIGKLGRATQSWLGVPMMVGGRVTGVISIQSLEREHAFDEGNRDLLSSVANQAAVAIENARLYSDLDKSVEELKETRAQLLAQSQLAALGTATAALQHRINNTLNLISPGIERLRKRVDPGDQDAAETLEIMERNARYVSEIIRRLQEPLKEEEQTIENVNSVLDEVVKKEKEHDPNSFNNVAVQFDLDPSIPLIEVGVGQISEVFRNMMDNAARAMKPQGGGTLRITSILTDHRIEVRVSDTGPGIPPNILERLFEKPVPPRDFGAGAGLGLWLSKLIFQRYGGTIEVENTGSGGTTILAILPTSRQ